MSDQTKIQWADSTWNPWIGCTKVSDGCVNCYAERSIPARRFGIEWGDGKKRRLAGDATWSLPKRWNKQVEIVECARCGAKFRCDPEQMGTPWACDQCQGVLITHRRRVFPSLCDPFDPEVPIEWFVQFMDLIRSTPNLDWLLVTKRPELWYSRLDAAFLSAWNDEDRTGKAGINTNCSDWIADWIKKSSVPDNVWIIASVENQICADQRIPELLKIPAAVRGISCEPLLGPVYLDPWITPVYEHRTGEKRMILPPALDWVIVGGESGPHARACNMEWIRSLVQQCKQARVPCFVKQLGARPWRPWSKPAGKTIPEIAATEGEAWTLKHPKGGDPEEWPRDLQVQEWPTL